MNFKLTKRRPNSVAPAVDLFNNWFNNHDKKVSMIKTKASRTISTSMHRSTIVNEPESNNNSLFYNTIGINRPQHNRTFSSYKDTQSRLTITKDQLTQITQEIKYLMQRARKARLDTKMLQKQYIIDIQRKQQQLKQQIFTLKKLTTYKIKDHEERSNKIKTKLTNIQSNYMQIKQKLNYIDEKITSIEGQCGFITLNNKLYK